MIKYDEYAFKPWIRKAYFIYSYLLLFILLAIFVFLASRCLNIFEDYVYLISSLICFGLAALLGLAIYGEQEKRLKLTKPYIFVQAAVMMLFFFAEIYANFNIAYWFVSLQFHFEFYHSYTSDIYMFIYCVLAYVLFTLIGLLNIFFGFFVPFCRLSKFEQKDLKFWRTEKRIGAFDVV